MAYKLVHITGNSYMLEGTVNIGVYHRGQGKCTLVDSGLEDDVGKRIINILKEKAMVVDSIINTHSHADHIGGNALIQKRTQCHIYATSMEAAIIENPIIEPMALYSAAPPNFLQNKFLMAKASKVTKIITKGKLNIDKTLFEIIALPGHSLGHIGVVTPDGVFYTGDSYFSKSLLEKHGFPYFQDIGATLKTLEYLENTNYSYYMPCHGKGSEHIQDIIGANIQSVEEVITLIMGMLKEPHSTEELCEKIYQHYRIKRTPMQYYLTWSTLSAYLSHLYHLEYIECKFYMHQLKWQRRKK